jgi:putative IMPACT (imprinted ancient) family translation regulator
MHCDFAELALVSARIRESGGEIARETFVADGAELTVTAPLDRLDAIAARVVDISRGRIQPRRDPG